MKSASAICFVVVMALLSPRPAVSDSSEMKFPPRPYRVDVPMRPDNITDAEVGEISGVVRDLYPSEFLNIGTVVDRCPCEDGPQCSSQVWVVAHKGMETRGLLLSRIDEEWQIGPVQAWWFDYNVLERRMRAVLRERTGNARDQWARLVVEQGELLRRSPRCDGDE